MTRIEEIQRDELQKLFGSFVNVRARIAPALVILASLVVIIDPSPWRRALLLGMASFMLLFSRFEAWRLAKRGETSFSFAGNLIAVAGVQAVVMFATGALETPVLIGIPVFIALAALAIGKRKELLLLMSIPIAAVWSFAVGEVYGLLPDVNLAVFGGGIRSGHNDVHLWTTAVVATAAFFFAAALGVFLRGAFDHFVAREVAAREAILDSHDRRAKELVALTGEIAHELKNPLATVKGLAALIAKDLGEGKTSERMTVLRREIDRMQGVLDDFLNFSRPLLPLASQPVTGAELVQEVVALHEGLAREKNIAVGTAAEGDTSLQCDPRKVEQVLMNLLQNALEACPPGSRVEVRAAGDGARVRFHVIDDGPGIDASVRGRIFDPGVSSKPKGSGIGLTIARALAAQHGGDLTVENAPRGGCEAVLRLPRTLDVLAPGG